MQNFDVIVIGAGAAGLMCAATAGYRGKSVLVIDHAPKAAAKIRISGGGKCNFTNLAASPVNYICQNPHFVKSALARYTAQDFIDLVDRHGLAYETRELGKLFCLKRASDLIQILRTECDWAGVEFLLNTSIQQLLQQEQGFCLTTHDAKFQASSVVVATGGLSFPKLKATGLGYQLAEQFGLAVLSTRPGLVPLVFDAKWQAVCQALSGISLEVAVSCGQWRFQEPMLFTHQGLSGPAILQISNYWQKGQPLQINLLPNHSVYSELLQLKQANTSLSKWLNQFWTKKMTQAWSRLYQLPEKLADESDERLHILANQIENWSLYPADTAGYDKAEVTLGGIDTEGVSSKTFEAKNQAGLYFIGEVLDVTGQLGGYNFQWAWSSGFACGQSV